VPNERGARGDARLCLVLVSPQWRPNTIAVRDPKIGPSCYSAARRLAAQSNAAELYALPRERLQLDGGARQPCPLRRLRATQRLAFERAVAGLLFGEHVVEDAGELLRHDGARDDGRLAARAGAVEGADLREVLDRANGRMAERDLEVAVPMPGIQSSRCTSGVGMSSGLIAAASCCACVPNNAYCSASIVVRRCTSGCLLESACRTLRAGLSGNIKSLQLTGGMRMAGYDHNGCNPPALNSRVRRAGRPRGRRRCVCSTFIRR
jgi:hypothetical protein